MMKTMAATDVKNKLGEALSFAHNDSLLIEKNGKPAFRVFTAEVGRMLVLGAYSRGELAREEAMRMLGFEWYGQLLDALEEFEFEHPSLPKDQIQKMSSGAVAVLKEAGEGEVE